MAEYRNVFKEDAQRQIERERNKPRAKPKPKPGPKKRPPVPVAPSQAKPLRASAGGDDWLASEAKAARERIKSGRKSNIQVGNQGFAYAGEVRNPGNLVSRIARNAAGDLTDIVTGIPAAGVLAGRAAAYPISKPLGMAGVGPARGFSEGTERLVGGAAKSIASEYKDVYGDILDVSALDLARDSDDARRKYREFGGKVVEHPVFRGLDAALVLGGAGAGIGAAGRAAGRLAPGTRVGKAGARMGSKAIGPGSARERAPRRLEVQLGENTGNGKKGPATNVVEIRRRQYSPNPITRTVQKRVVDPLVDKSIARIDRNPDGVLAGVVGTEARYNRRAARAGRDLGRDFELQRGKVVRQEAGPLRDATRKLSKPEQAALFLHRRDLLDVPGKTPRQARDDVVRMMEEGRASIVGTRGAKDKNTQKTIEALRSIPDEMLDLRTARPELAKAVAEARRIGEQATTRRVAAGTLDAEGAAARARRPAEMVHGGSRFDPKLVAETPEVLAARQALGEAIGARAAGPRRPRLQQMFSAGRRTGRGERNLQLARPIPTTPRRQPASPSPGDLGPRGGVKITGPGFARPEGISASQARAYRQVLGGRGRQVELKGATKLAEQQARQVREARSRLTKVEKRNRGSFTPPSRTDVGRRAVYDPDIPVDRLAGRSSSSAGASMNRLTQEKNRQSKGTLVGSGNVSLSPETTRLALERAVADELHPKMMKRFEEEFAFKRADGSTASGDDAIIKMEANGDTVALVSRKSFEDARKRVENLPEGQLPDGPPLGDKDIFHGEDGLKAARGLKGKKRNDLIAVSKSALEGLREGWAPTIKGGKLRHYDNPLSMWKRGILTFAPRWYLNNAFGNTLQYGLLTGGDFKSIFQAKRSRAGEGVPERVGGGLIEQTRIEYGSTMGREPGRARKGFEKVSDFGFKVNHTFESVMRRAAYINQVKKGLRREGMLTRSQVRKLSDDDLMKALDNAPRHVREQALREVEFFLGDYVRLNRFEQNYLRRIFPWYSWMRVIGRLSLGLPFRHPKRTAIASLVAEASGDVVNPEDEILPLYDRGRIKLPGGLAQRTSGLNPFSTHLETAGALSEAVDIRKADPGELVGSLVRDMSPIGLQQLAAWATSRNAFGEPFSAPIGYAGAQAFGQGPMGIDPLTELPEDRQARPPLDELLLQAIPHLPQIARAIGSRGRSPYDTARTLDLLFKERTPENMAEMFWPKSRKPRASEPLNPYLQPFLSIAGANIRRRNPEAEVRRHRDQQKRLREAERQTRKRRAKAAARER